MAKNLIKESGRHFVSNRTAAAYQWKEEMNH
jgi:hypothetical protein